MSVIPRGSWSISKAVEAKWTAANLDTLFRADWGADQTSTSFFTLNDTEARPSNQDHPHPRPYCIYEVGTAIAIGASTGRANDIGEDQDPLNTMRQYLDVPLQFTIYGTTKAKAVQFAKLVRQAFDRALLTLEEDEQIDMMIDPDFGTREDDQTWSWTLQYRVRIDAKYAVALS